MTRTNNETTANALVSLLKRAGEAQNPNGEYITEQDEAVILNHLRFAETLFPDSGLMLCPVSHSMTRYFSANFEAILGYTQQELMQWSVADFLALVHPEDLLPVHQCLDYIRRQMPYDPSIHRFNTTYRMRTTRSGYVVVKDEKMAVKTINNHYLQLILLSRAPDEEKFHHVQLDIFKKIKGIFYKIDTYNPQQDKIITPRQSDIASLIVKGFTNQEIADKLNVSVYTVKNHKQLLFKKVKVRNSIQLANYFKNLTPRKRVVPDAGLK